MSKKYPKLTASIAVCAFAIVFSVVALRVSTNSDRLEIES